MSPPSAAAGHFRALLSGSCSTCGSAWERHSLCLIGEAGHGLLLCPRGHLFSVLYPEGEVLAVDGLREALDPAGTPPSELNDETVIDPLAELPLPLFRAAWPGLFSAPPRGGRTLDDGPTSGPRGYRPEAAVHPVRCPLCGGDARFVSRRPVSLCIDCVRGGFAVLTIATRPRLVCDGRPLPWSPEIHFPGEEPRRSAPAAAIA